MRAILIAFLLFFAGPAPASEAADCIPANECSTVCNKGKACGGSCIKFSFMCSKDPADWVAGMPCDSNRICTGDAAVAACAALGCEATPVDADGDGYDETVDCNDADPTIHPCAVDAPGDGIDSDCYPGGTPDPACDGGADPGPSGGKDFVAVAQPSWWQGITGTANFVELADTWHINGSWIWCEDAKYCSEYVLPDLLRNDRMEVIWLNLYGHQGNCGGPAVYQYDGCGNVIYQSRTGTDAAGCPVYDTTSSPEYDPDHWPGGYDEATCEEWLSYAYDRDGPGPDKGWAYKEDRGGYYNFGQGYGWLDINPSTGVPYARLLDECFDSGRCKIMLMDDVNNFHGPDDFRKQDGEDLSAWIKANLWPNAYTMVRKAVADIRGPALNTPDGKYHALDATTSMFYASGHSNPYGRDIASWIAVEEQNAEAWGTDLIYNLSPNTGGLDGPDVEGFAPAMSAQEILDYGLPMCASAPAVEVSVYQVGRRTDASYLYWTQPDVSAAIEQVGAACRGQ